ncbi:MAG TPA: hypothetical protein VG406_27095 [Isosphaeraceae bacterium]|nr:hypothetical protein [Isosphaeraceae bacterium]
MSMRISAVALVSLAYAVACPGCGEANSAHRKPTIPVKGKVTYKGKPLTKGLVTFDARDIGRPATGEIKPDGTYELSTIDPGDGVVAGHHRVTITETGTRPGKEVIPKKYALANSSTLEADVSPDKTEFTFDLQ